MKKLLITISLSIAVLMSFGQSAFHGLIAHNYLETNRNGEFKPVKKTIYIVYNDQYCRFFINGASHDFSVVNYSRSLENGFIKESFLSGETSSTPEGWYLIDVVHNHNGAGDINIQMSLSPAGHAIDVKNAQDYNADGKVSGRTYVTNWKELAKKMKTDDSIMKVNNINQKLSAIQERKNGSIQQIIRKVEAQKTRMKELETGNNYNNSNVKAATLKIDSLLGLETNGQKVYGNIRILIDTSGRIKSCGPGNPIDMIGPFIPALNKIFETYAIIVQPFAENGRSYPSYSSIFISSKAKISK